MKRKKRSTDMVMDADVVMRMLETAMHAALKN